MQGRIEAASPDLAASQLALRGITPLRIQPAVEKQSLRGRASGFWPSPRVKLADLTMLTRQMYSLTKAGVPIIQTLRGLVETTRSPELARVLEDLALQLQSGRELAASMQRHPRVFSNLYVSVIHVGESVGRLEESLLELYQYLELEEETRKRVKSATRYPMLVVVAIIAALIIINLFVIPPFARMFAGFGRDLPWATLLLIGFSNLSVKYWPHCLVTGAAGFLAARRYVRTAAGSLHWDRLKLRLPIMGSILERALLARFCRTLSVTLSSGLPVTQSLSVASRTVDNRWVGGRVLAMRAAIERGETLTRAANASELFPSLVLQMMRVGEETGSVDDVLREVAEFYEREVDYELKRIGDSIEPILISTIGAIVLVLALGVYLPMWDMAAAARGH